MSNKGAENKSPRRWRYLALGDSYTIGEAVDPDLRFPAQLTAQLRAWGWDMDEPELIAHTGWTTDELAGAIRQRAPHGPFDLVTLLIGVNNQYRGRSPENYRPEFIALLEQAIRFAGDRPGRVFVLSIPDWGVTPFGRERENVSVEIDAFNRVNREETLRRGAHYVEITRDSRAARVDAGLIAADGLHPSGKMYAMWVERLVPQVIEALEANKTQSPGEPLNPA